jgi:hypothetical protein
MDRTVRREIAAVAHLEARDHWELFVCAAAFGHATDPLGELFRSTIIDVLVERYTAALPERSGYFWLIGSIRRECCDHVIVFGERHLRRGQSAC